MKRISLLTVILVLTGQVMADDAYFAVRKLADGGRYLDAIKLARTEYAGLKRTGDTEAACQAEMLRGYVSGALLEHARESVDRRELVRHVERAAAFAQASSSDVVLQKEAALLALKAEGLMLAARMDDAARKKIDRKELAALFGPQQEEVAMKAVRLAADIAAGMQKAADRKEQIVYSKLAGVRMETTRLARTLAPAKAAQALASAATARGGVGRNEIIRIMEVEKITIRFDRTPLPEALEFFRQTKGINFIVDHRMIGEPEERKISLNATGLKVSSALRLCLEQLDLVYDVEDDCVIVTTKEGMRVPKVTRVYDISDLTGTIKHYSGPKKSLSSHEGGGMTGGENDEEIVISAEQYAEAIRMLVTPTQGEWGDDKNVINVSN